MILLRNVALVGGLFAAATVSAQSAADFFNAQITNQAIGTGYSVSNVVANSFNATRGRGISNFQQVGSSISSGAGRTSATAGLPLVGSGVGGSGKPFQSLNRSPTVSPYLNLFNTGVGGAGSSFDNYNTLVRPQLNQQRTNRQLQMQNQRLNQRVQSISAQAAFNPEGSERMMATGHSTVFGYYGRFYPLKNARRR